MNYSQICLAVQRRLQDTSSTTYTAIKDFVNMTLQEMIEQALFVPGLEKKATLTTVANQMNYSLSSDVDRLYDVYQGNTPAKLTPMTPDQFDSIKPSPSTSTGATGQPINYYLFGIDASGNKVIYLYPIPDAVYTISYRYYAQFTPLSADSDTPPTPRRYDWTIVQGAYAKASEYNEESATDDARKDYATMLENYKQGIERENPDLITAVRIQVFDSFAPLDSTANPLDQGV